MKKLESINSDKFKSLSNEEMNKLNGGKFWGWAVVAVEKITGVTTEQHFILWVGTANVRAD